MRRLAPLLSATAYKHVIGVKYDPVKVGAALRPPLSDYLRAPRDARWKVVGDKGRVLSSLSGIDLDAAHDGAPPHARGRATTGPRASRRSRSGSRSPS